MNAASEPTWRIGAVSYLNSKPLIYGLDHEPRVALSLDVPAKLIDGLRDARFDVALLPVIDYQRLENLVVIPAGGIGCDGPTLTVRLFSRTPIEQMTTLACDVESHTSVALARIILKREFGISPELIPLQNASDKVGETRLLIGDKVITSEPAGFTHQLDLGSAWKDLTGRPFVFAIWTARDDVDLGELPAILSAALKAGLDHVDEIVADHAPKLGWPLTTARQYLTSFLKFQINRPQLEAIQLFHEYAEADALIPSPRQKLRIASTQSG